MIGFGLILLRIVMFGFHVDLTFYRPLFYTVQSVYYIP